MNNNQIIDVKGEGPIAEEKRQEFHQEAALRNNTEVAIGCNDKAVVTGNTLKDEKVGFLWAYGRSDLFSGRIGVEGFTSPDSVCHSEFVYARGTQSSVLGLILFLGGKRQAVIKDVVLCV